MLWCWDSARNKAGNLSHFFFHTTPLLCETEGEKSWTFGWYASMYM